MSCVTSRRLSSGSLARRRSVPVSIGSSKRRQVVVGGDFPVLVQSMTDTDTADVDATVAQVAALAKAGSEIVRITVDRDDSARAVPHIRDKLLEMNVDVPLVGDFHYIGHKLLKDHPACAEALDKYRINPGNVGFKNKRDPQFREIINMAIRYGKPVRIGGNWGSLDQDLASHLMDENAKKDKPLSTQEVMREAITQSVLHSAVLAEEEGLPRERIILSAKVSDVQELISVYRELGRVSDYALHLGLTEAGMNVKGIVASTAALSVLLQEGIGDTIRCSLTPEPGGDRRREVETSRHILQSLGLRYFAPSVTSCPGCGRTTSQYFRALSNDVQTWLSAQLEKWSKDYPDVVNMKVAVMGCIVNGPGESKHANIGISLPGTGEHPSAPVFVDGEKFTTLKGERITDDFKEIITSYVQEKYVKKDPAPISEDA